jgi:predicted MFS family arabinose efflux permease
VNNQKLWTWNFISICFSSFFIFITFYTLMATLPQFITEEMHGNQQQVGWVMTSFIIAAVIFRPLAGRWLTTMSRKRVLLISIVVFVIASMFYFSIYSFGLLLVLRFIHGMSFGVATTATGTIASDIIPDQRKGEGLGYFTLSMNLAMVLGPFLGLLLLQHSSFNVLFAILSLFAVLALFSSSTTRVPTPAVVNNIKVSMEHSKWWEKYIEPKSLPISLVAMFLAISYSGILIYVYGFAQQIGIGSSASYFFVVYAVMMIVTRPFTGRMFDRLGDHRIVYPSIILYVVGLVVLSQADSLFLFLLSAAIIGMGYGTVFPCLQTIALRSSSPQRRGLATSTFFLFFDMGAGIGSITLGVIASNYGERSMYLISAGIVAISLLLYYGLYNRKRKAPVSSVSPALSTTNE